MNDPLVVLAIGALLGLALGMLGGGGGVLAVPLLVAIGEPVIVASTMSLVIVGTASMAALVPHHRARRVDWEVGLTFGVLGAVGAVAGARTAQLVDPRVVLAGMTVLLLLGAAAMFRATRRARRARHVEDLESAPARPAPVRPTVPSGDVELVAGEALVETEPTSAASSTTPTSQPSARPTSRLRTVSLATAVGFVTGFFGVGAGFVVVPALVAAMRLPIKRATATALVVIVINSAVALVVRHHHLGAPGLTVTLAATSALFAVIGAQVSHRVPAWVLSGAFGTLMVVVSGYTLTRVLPG